MKYNAKTTEKKRYYYGDSKWQYYMYFAPQTTPEDKVIVFIHGGGWNHGNPDFFRFVGNVFSKRGYHTISIGYRHSPKAKQPDIEDDVAFAYSDAMDFLQRMGVNTDKVVIVGSSAGGHLGGLLVYNTQLQKKYNINAKNIMGMVSLSGALSFSVPYWIGAKHLFRMYFKKGAERKNAEPYNFISKEQKTKFLCVHSYDDPLINWENQKKFCDKANLFEKGRAEFYTPKNNKKYYHSNLAISIFFDDENKKIKGGYSPVKYVYDWIERL